MGKWEIESTPVPGDDTIISQTTTTTTHPPTFNHEGVSWQQSAFRKNVLGWSPKPIQHKNDQVDSKNKNQGESNMINEKFIKNP